MFQIFTHIFSYLFMLKTCCSTVETYRQLSVNSIFCYFYNGCVQLIALEPELNGYQISSSTP